MQSLRVSRDAYSKNRRKLRHRRKRGSASSVHVIRKKHKPNNRKSTRKNLGKFEFFPFTENSHGMRVFFRFSEVTVQDRRLMYYNVFFFLGESVMEKSAVVTVRLSKRDLERVEAVRVLEDVDRSTLIKEFIEDGLRRRVVDNYRRGKLTAGRAAEILGISLREFFEILEREGVPVNWDSESVKEYLKARYGA